MPTLPDEVKTFIVEQLACFEPPQRVADAVKEEFGLTIPRQQVVVYDPEKGCRTKKWVALHTSMRQAFLDGKVATAIERRGWRLRMIERMALRAEKARNYKLAAGLLEQAAKEEGGAYRAAQRVGATTNTPETDEDRVLKMRAAMDAMDAVTVPSPPPPTGPTLVTDSKAVA